MKTVFVGGSRRISRLGSDLRGRLDQIVEKNLCVLLGDANGADKAVQSYLKERSYPHVIIFCTAGQCRNNLGHWRVESVAPPHKAKDFQFFSAKDAAMAREADVGLMIWDGESSGTMVNAARLVGSGKPVVVYVAPQKTFRTVKSPAQLEKLLLGCPAEIRDRIDRYISEHAHEYRHPALFQL
jgi:adenine-specific DNA-methyltransferase